MIGSRGDFYFMNMKLGDTMIELVEPAKDGPLKQFLAKRGQGMHHISLEVNNLAELIEKLEKGGYRVVEKFDGGTWKTAFISPRSARGVLIQVWESKKNK